MTAKEIFNPLGPFGSSLIGVALFIVAVLWPAASALMWLTIAFFFGGFIMITTRLINRNKSLMDKS